MISNNRYNKTKLLTDLSGICWFLEKYAIPDAEKSQDTCCVDIFNTIKQDFEKNIQAIQKAVCEETKS